MTDIEKILGGQVGVFSPVYGSDLPAIDCDAYEPGYVKLKNGRVQVDLIIDLPDVTERRTGVRPW